MTPRSIGFFAAMALIVIGAFTAFMVLTHPDPTAVSVDEPKNTNTAQLDETRTVAVTSPRTQTVVEPEVAAAPRTQSDTQSSTVQSSTVAAPQSTSPATTAPAVTQPAQQPVQPQASTSENQQPQNSVIRFINNAADSVVGAVGSVLR